MKINVQGKNNNKINYYYYYGSDKKTNKTKAHG